MVGLFVIVVVIFGRLTNVVVTWCKLSLNYCVSLAVAKVHKNQPEHSNATLLLFSSVLFYGTELHSGFVLGVQLDECLQHSQICLTLEFVKN